MLRSSLEKKDINDIKTSFDRKRLPSNDIARPELSAKKENKPMIKRYSFNNKSKVRADYDQSTDILLDRSIVRKERVIIDSMFTFIIYDIENILKKVDVTPLRPDTPPPEERSP